MATDLSTFIERGGYLDCSCSWETPRQQEQDSELGARIIRANPVFIEDGQKLEGVSESDRDALRSYAEAKVAEIMAAWKPFIDG